MFYFVQKEKKIITKIKCYQGNYIVLETSETVFVTIAQHIRHMIASLGVVTCLRVIMLMEILQFCRVNNEIKYFE